MSKFDSVRKIVAPLALVGALGACGQIELKEPTPARREPTTGLTAEQFAEQNNGNVAWLPGHGREQNVENTYSFCEELGGQVKSVVEYEVVCLFDGVEVKINTSWNSSYFDKLMGDICEHPPISGAVILVEKNDPPKGDPVFACFRPESSAADQTS